VHEVLIPSDGLTDGVVQLRRPSAGDAALLVAGRDQEFHRFLGEGSAEPQPTAIVSVPADRVIGWIDVDTDRAWLAPGEINIGYNIFEQHRRRGYARRSLALLLLHLRRVDEVTAATLLIDPANNPSIGVAEQVGFTQVDDIDGQLLYRHPVE